MKKFTLLQSAFALIAAFMLALPARAQVASAADLFGTYKFTADVNVTDEGKEYTDYFKNECEVVITKSSNSHFIGEIQGLAGATAAQRISDIDLSANTIKIPNPNGNYDVWAGKLHMSDAEGNYPYTKADGTPGYGDVKYTFDPSTKNITLSDFTLVTCDYGNETNTIVASFTNAKLTFVQSESIEVADLSGDWHYIAGKGTYDTMEGSTLPTEWDMTLTATDNSKKAYNISLTLGDFAPLALTATFDGVTLTIPFNEDYFDAEQKIGLVNMYGVARPGTITFNMTNENLLSQANGMTIAQDSISPEVPGGYKQWYQNGLAKRQGGETEKVTWEGTYKIKAGSIMKQLTEFDYPEEFDMVVTYNADYDIYLVTEFFGCDVTALNYGGISFKPSTDDPNKAEISTNPAYLKTITAGTSYLTLKDLNLSTASNIVITRLEDGTYTLSDFTITNLIMDASNTPTHNFAAYYQTVTATKEETVKPEPFSWAGTFTVKGDVTSYDGNSYPESFEMEVTYNADYDMYLVTKFFGNDVTALNYGGILLTPSTEDANKAEMNTGGFIGTIEAGKTYYKLFDMNATTSPLTLTVNEDGTVSISNFCVSIMNYDTQETKAVALYSNAIASKGTVEPEPEPEPFSWAGTFTVKGNVTSYDGNTYPESFEMEVTYNADYDMYLVTKFFGNDVTALNYGGILLTPSTEDANKAEMNTGGFIGTIEAGKTYYKLFDMNATTSPLTLTVNEDGTVSINSFCVSIMDYDTQETKAVALYSNVTATSSSSSIEDITAAPALNIWSANGTIYVAGEAQAIEVYDMSGRTVFSGVASQVSGLNKGLYLVKVKNAVAKVAVK
ncbi:MAG: T9SS type A sorting domain-containing protein [Bacteroidaceae bacterium]|nr:T9SS type A sorting domain-containing protein [Bacteroidaceae bacterium]